MVVNVREQVPFNTYGSNQNEVTKVGKDEFYKQNLAKFPIKQNSVSTYNYKKPDYAHHNACADSVHGGPVSGCKLYQEKKYA